MDNKYTYEDLNKFYDDIKKITDPIFKMGGETAGVTVEDIKARGGKKEDLAGTIFKLLRCVNKSKDWLKKLHAYNFELQSKIVKSTMEGIESIKRITKQHITENQQCGNSQEQSSSYNKIVCQCAGKWELVPCAAHQTSFEGSARTGKEVKQCGYTWTRFGPECSI